MLLITLLDDNEAKPPIIVAYLRKSHICNNIFFLAVFNLFDLIAVISSNSKLIMPNQYIIKSTLE
jgi:hypothetical protein